MDYQAMDQAQADYLPKAKTPVEHQRDMLAIAQQQLALACARSLTEPDHDKWSTVILRLIDWLRRLEGSEAALAEVGPRRLLSH